MITSSHIGEIITIEEIKGQINFNQASIAYNSKKVESGDLFVCIKGFNVDGHDFLEEAIRKGAVAAVVEDIQPVDFPQIRVLDTRMALAHLGAGFYDFPSTKLKVIGITATNGKTTTAYMLEAILKAHHITTGVIGTIAIQMGEVLKKASLTTPESLDLQHYLSDMVDYGVTHVTMEASSAAIELKRIEGVDYDIGVLNNLTKEHLDFHKSLEAYREAKKSFIRSIKETGWVVLNIDDSQARTLIGQTKAHLLTFGIDHKEGDISIKDLDLSTGIARFKLVVQKPFKKIKATEFDMVLSVAGYHSVYNAISAISIALLLDIPIKVIQQGIYNFKGVERRFELIYNEKFKVFDDHFANYANIDITLKTLAMMAYKSVVLVYAIRGSRGIEVNKENAEAIVKWAKEIGFNHFIATTSRKTTGEKDFVTEAEKAIFLKIINEAKLKVDLYTTLDEAITEALSRVQEKDVILLAGCQGMDYAGHIILDKLSRNMATEEKERIQAPLKYRVVGSEAYE